MLKLYGLECTRLHWKVSCLHKRRLIVLIVMESIGEKALQRYLLNFIIKTCFKCKSTICFMFKIRHSKLPAFLIDLFKINSNVRMYSTRHATHISDRMSAVTIDKNIKCTRLENIIGYCISKNWRSKAQLEVKTHDLTTVGISKIDNMFCSTYTTYTFIQRYHWYAANSHMHLRMFLS